MKNYIGDGEVALHRSRFGNGSIKWNDQCAARRAFDRVLQVNRNLRRDYPKSSAVSSIGAPCGVRSAA